MTIEASNEAQTAEGAVDAQTSAEKSTSQETGNHPSGKTLVKMRQSSGVIVTVPAEDLMAQHLAPLATLINSLMPMSQYAHQAFVNLKQTEDWLFFALREYTQREAAMKKARADAEKKAQDDTNAPKEAVSATESAPTA